MFENDYTINGKHATYLKFLAAKNSGAKDADETSPTAARIFERYIDVYMNAAIWGLLYERTAPKDSGSDDRARIYADAYATEDDEDIDPAIYEDPILMVKWLERRQKIADEEKRGIADNKRVEAE